MSPEIFSFFFFKHFFFPGCWGHPLESHSKNSSGEASWVRREKVNLTSDIFPSHVALGVGRCDVARCPLLSPVAVEKKKKIGCRELGMEWGWGLKVRR